MLKKRKKHNILNKLINNIKLQSLSTRHTNYQNPNINRLKARKNYLPTLIAIIVSWLIIGLYITTIDPAIFGAVVILLILVFVSGILTFSTLFANVRRGLIASLALTFFLILRYFGIGNFFNFLLIIGLAVVVEFYFSQN